MLSFRERNTPMHENHSTKSKKRRQHMLCNGNVPDANSPINFKNDSFCPASSRDFSILGNKSIMSLTKIHEGVVPSNLTKYGKCITVNDGLTYILDKKFKRKKLNTPVKENF
jgi:hypothetical protein